MYKVALRVFFVCLIINLKQINISRSIKKNKLMNLISNANQELN